VAASPEIEKKSAGPGEHEIAVMDGDRLANIGATSLGITSTIALAKLTSLEHGKTGVIASRPELLHCKSIHVASDVKQ